VRTPELAAAIADRLDTIRSRKPLVHHITNNVVTNLTANVTLAIGALPVMAPAIEESGQMVGAAGALVLNIGTLDPAQIESMVVAGRAANKLGIPIVLDPVGAGATTLRTDATHRLLRELTIAIVRGNAGEVGVAAGAGGEVKGVESVGAEGDVPGLARVAASRFGLVAAITGKRDTISDGRRLGLVDNGHVLLRAVTGTGCSATTAVACFAAVESDFVLAATAALVCVGIAAEVASEKAGGPGTFVPLWLDALFVLNRQIIADRCRAWIEE
jgi:hydroxyethylthiazole kinase